MTSPLEQSGSKDVEAGDTARSAVVGAHLEFILAALHHHHARARTRVVEHQEPAARTPDLGRPRASARAAQGPAAARAGERRHGRVIAITAGSGIAASGAWSASQCPNVA